MNGLRLGRLLPLLALWMLVGGCGGGSVGDQAAERPPPPDIAVTPDPEPVAEPEPEPPPPIVGEPMEEPVLDAEPEPEPVTEPEPAQPGPVVAESPSGPTVEVPDVPRAETPSGPGTPVPSSPRPRAPSGPAPQAPTTGGLSTEAPAGGGSAGSGGGEGQAEAPRPSSPAFAADSLADQTVAGVLAWNPPDSMHVGVTRTVYLTITPGISMDVARERLEARVSADSVLSDSLRVSEYMRATLSGSNFAVDPEAPAEQPMSANAESIWQWEVTPQREGRHHLVLRIETLVERAAPDRWRVYDIYEDTVAVSISPDSVAAAGAARRTAFLTAGWEFFSENLEFLWVAIVAPVGAFLYRRFRRTEET